MGEDGAACRTEESPSESLPHWGSGNSSQLSRQRFHQRKSPGEVNYILRGNSRAARLEKEMATHSSTLAWRIPWTEEPGGLQSMESQSWTPLTNTHTKLRRYLMVQEHTLSTLPSPAGSRMGQAAPGRQDGLPRPPSPLEILGPQCLQWLTLGK